MNNSRFSEIKRTLIAGSLIALLLMSASWLGIFNSPESEEIDLTESKLQEKNKPDSTQADLDVYSLEETSKEAVVEKTNFDIIKRTINNGVVQAELSSFGGGSFITYKLIDKRKKQYKYLGNFSYNSGYNQFMSISELKKKILQINA